MDESITDNFLGITDAAAFYKENRMINDKNNLSMWAVIALLLEWKKRQAPAPTSCFRKRAVGGGMQENGDNYDNKIQIYRVCSD